MMGDVAKGLKSFKQGMSEEDEIKARNPDQRAPEQQRQIPPQQPPIDITPQAPRAPDAAAPPARDDTAL
jgi:sec-independent protein translocase protein TatA